MPISLSRIICGAATVAAGLLFTFAFPKWNIAGAAWVAPGLLLFAALGAGRRGAFAVGFVGGFVHGLASLSWLLNIPYTFHGLPLAPTLGWIALSSYVALYPAVWVWLCWKLFSWNGNTPTLGEFAARSGWERTRWCFLCAAAWVGLEVFRAGFLSGFPWNPLGASQYSILPLIQVASLGGVYAISFLVIWTSVSIVAALAVMMGSQPVRISGAFSGAFSGSLMRDAFPALLAVALSVSFGMHRIFSSPPPARELVAALIQPSIPQTLIWDSNANAARFEKVLELSKQALAHKPDLLVWPESALPETSDENLTTLANLAKSNHVWIILCVDDADPPSALGQLPKYYNASILISPEGRPVERYRKHRLVIFGEYVPMADWLPFLKWFTPVDGGFTPGIGPVPFMLTQPEAEASVLICFEDVFPQEARVHVTAGTDFLLNLTNDGWFGRGAAQWQQAATALFRAVENGVPLVRCTNDGLTCWIDEVGRIRQIGNPDDIYGSGYLIARIALPASGTRTPTFYNRHGDLFGWTCAGWVLILSGLSWVRNRVATS